MKKIDTDIRDNSPIFIHNDLANARGDFTACMLDILFYILSDIKAEENTYLIKVKDIETITGRKWNYQQLRASTKEMGSRPFEIENPKKGTKLLQLWFFSSVEYFDGTGTLEVELSKKILPYLIDLKSNFTTLQLKSILGTSSKYAKRFYMLGCRYRSMGKVPKMTIDELKIMLALKDPSGKEKEQYTKFSAFKSKVLDVAISQVNEYTDIQMSYELIKRGRSYYWIDIKINFQAIKQMEFDFSKPTEIQKTFKTIMHYGFTESQAVPMAKSGMKLFKEIMAKTNARLTSGELSGTDKVNAYVVGIYQSKGVLVKHN